MSSNPGDPFEFLKKLWAPMGLPMSGTWMPGMMFPSVDIGEIVERDRALDREFSGDDVVCQLRDELLRHAIALDDATHSAAVLQKRRFERHFGAGTRAAEVSSENRTPSPVSLRISATTSVRPV